MWKVYDSDYVSGLEHKVTDLEAELRAWKFNAVYLDLDEKYAVWAREADERLEQMDERERREMERIDDMLQDLGL